MVKSEEMKGKTGIKEKAKVEVTVKLPSLPRRDVSENNLEPKFKAQLIALREELEALCRHHQDVLAEKKEEMDRFNEELKGINKNESRVLKDIDNIKKPLPLFDPGETQSKAPDPDKVKGVEKKSDEGSLADYAKNASVGKSKTKSPAKKKPDSPKGKAKSKK